MQHYVNLARTAWTHDRRLLIDVGLTLGVNCFGTILLFAMQVLLARLLGEAGYSLFSYAFAILTVLTTLGLFGFDVAIQRYVPTAIEEGDWGTLRGYMRRALQVLLAVTVTLGLGLIVTVLALDGLIEEELQALLMVAACAIPGGSLLLLYSACARALGHPLLAAAPRLVFKPLAIMGALALLAAMGAGIDPVRAMLAEIIAALALTGLVALAVSHRLRPLIRDAQPSFETRAWLAVSFPLFLNAAFQILTRQTDVLVLGAFIGAGEVGSYVVATKIAALAAFGLLAINAVLPPLIVKHIVRGETDEARRILAIASLAMFAFAVGSAVVLWALGEVILGWFGDEFIAAKPILNILIVGQLLNAMTGSVSYVLAVTGQQKVLAKVVAGALLLNIALCLALIPQFGAAGAAIAVATATSVSNLVLLFLCKSRSGLDPSIWGAIRSLLER